MNKDREKCILEILLQEKKVYVKELAARLYASEPSIRRDLASLESQKLLKRIHGGAILEETAHSEMHIPFLLREYEQMDAKLIMAKKAAELVRDGDLIMLDASSSAYSIIPFLSGKNNLMVITSGIKALMKLGEYHIEAYSTGGELLPECYSLVGEEAHRMISGYNADIAFFSCRGISPEGMATDFSINENRVRQKMMRHSKKNVLLCAGEKFGNTYMHNLCSINELDCVISERELPEFDGSKFE